MKVVINGKEYVARKHTTFPWMNLNTQYILYGPNGRMKTAITTGKGGKNPEYVYYVYFEWSDGFVYYLPTNVVPPDRSIISEVKETASCERQS